MAMLRNSARRFFRNGQIGLSVVDSFRGLTTECTQTTLSSESYRRRLALNAYVADSIMYPNTKTSYTVLDSARYVMLESLTRGQPKKPRFVVVGKQEARTKTENVLCTEWNGENVGTVVEIVNYSKGSDFFLVDVVGCERVLITHKERLLTGTWEIIGEVIDEQNANVAAAKALAKQAKWLLAEKVKKQFTKEPLPQSLRALLESLSGSQSERDMSTFSFRLASVLTLDASTQMRLLVSTSVIERLQLEVDLLRSAQDCSTLIDLKKWSIGPSTILPNQSSVAVAS